VAVFEHFTERARRVLVLSAEEAQHLRDGLIGPQHVLLGLLREGEGIAAKALSFAGADYEGVRAVIDGDACRRDSGQSGQQPAFSVPTLRVIERSVLISWARADGGIDTEHLLVALLEQQDEITEAVLAELDITPQEVVQRANDLLIERRSSANGGVNSSPSRPLALDGDRTQRLEVLEGVLWGIDHLHEVTEVLRESENTRLARDTLMAPPFSLSRNQANGVLDLSVDSVTVERRQQVVDEIELLRREVSDD
jgi:ATP-dependent Clp protease ATP-binding subunit ClpA